jgi:transcriptional regulator with XRE-family HTH domain
MDTSGVDAYTATMTYGEKVAALRIERGWTQVELAKRSGLDSQTIHRIEKGKIKGGPNSRAKLAKAFGIPIAAFDQHTDIEEAVNDAATRRLSSSSTIALAALTEQQLLEGIAALVRELERRQGGDRRSDRPTTPDDPHQPPARPRRHR